MIRTPPAGANGPRPRACAADRNRPMSPIRSDSKRPPVNVQRSSGDDLIAFRLRNIRAVSVIDETVPFGWLAFPRLHGHARRAAAPPEIAIYQCSAAIGIKPDSVDFAASEAESTRARSVTVGATTTFTERCRTRQTSAHESDARPL